MLHKEASTLPSIHRSRGNCIFSFLYSKVEEHPGLSASKRSLKGDNWHVERTWLHLAKEGHLQVEGDLQVDATGSLTSDVSASHPLAAPAP